MNIDCAGKYRKYSAGRLRRARRLYAYLIFENCIGNKHQLAVCAVNAQKRGLYASKSLRDVYFLMARALYKLDSQTNIYLPDWHNWLSTFDMSIGGHAGITRVLREAKHRLTSRPNP